MAFNLHAALARSLFVAAAALPASACAPDRTVSYYRENETERLAMVEECRDDVTRSKTEPDCLNALQADREVEAARRLEEHKKYVERRKEVYGF